jgi:hypothetical protein
MEGHRARTGKMPKNVTVTKPWGFGKDCTGNTAPHTYLAKKQNKVTRDGRERNAPIN